MSNLSWLNPTPDAIAVYASRPLSPVAPQHSLPSERYSLLGPDSYEAPHVKRGFCSPGEYDRAALKTQQLLHGLATLVKPQSRLRCAESAGLEERRQSVIISSGLLRSAVVDLLSI